VPCPFARIAARAITTNTRLRNKDTSSRSSVSAANPDVLLPGFMACKAQFPLPLAPEID
jgi:hypothetical protein